MARRFGAGALVALAILAPTGARAGDAETCKALVDKAIAAAGGADKLAQLNSATWRARNAERGTETMFAGQMPDKFRNESRRPDETGKVVHRVSILNGNRGWIVTDGKAVEKSPEMIARAHLTFYHKSLAWVIVPLRDPALKLKPLGEASVEGKPADGIEIERADKPTVKMYFDRASGLPVKTETMTKDKTTGKDVVQELIYSDHRTANGVKFPGKTTIRRDGVQVGVTEVTEFKADKNLDPKLFLAP